MGRRALEYEELIVRDGRDWATVARAASPTGRSRRPANPGTRRGLRRGAGLRRELRAGAHPRCVPPRTAGTQPHPQRGPHAGRNAGHAGWAAPCGSAAGKTNIVATAQAVARGDMRTFSARTGSAGAGEDAGHRGRAPVEDHGYPRLRRLLSGDGADRRQPRPARAAQSGQRRPRPAGDGRMGPGKRGAASSVSSPPMPTC